MYYDTKYGYDYILHPKIYYKELTWRLGTSVVWGKMLLDIELYAMRSSFVVLRIGTVPEGQASFGKPIIEGLFCERFAFFVVLCEKWGLSWRNKNSN